MDISKITNKNELPKLSSYQAKKASKSFSDSFNSATKEQRQKQLEKLLVNIKKKGKQIIETRSLSDIREYKNNIKEYLSIILEDSFKVQKLRSMYNGNPSVYVQIINEKLNELAQAVLEQENGNIKLINKIEEIEGLLLDSYQ